MPPVVSPKPEVPVKPAHRDSTGSVYAAYHVPTQHISTPLQDPTLVHAPNIGQQTFVHPTPAYPVVQGRLHVCTYEVTLTFSLAVVSLSDLELLRKRIEGKVYAMCYCFI